MTSRDLISLFRMGDDDHGPGGLGDGSESDTGVVTKTASDRNPPCTRS